ncbi:hypothetical protein Drose_04565 [Dactylosporangium roseum]|uniref:Uncharacterized protein n=1 Tax=Dactylosporangium roseum TaxID=47989 RepID=A0ABY5ZA17_9ACTN|nr:hypothetical protein [Dactylosporangium roseum]UWZ37563.1 hypothetical protein Drose_04565 [Dactylosporangium roseum]
MNTLKTPATAEQQWDRAIEAARLEPTESPLAVREALLALDEAADCADRAVIDGVCDAGTWYAFAVGVAAHDPRSAHLFA